MLEIPISQTIIEKFDKVFIDETSRSSKVAQRVLKYFPKEKIEIVIARPVWEVGQRGTDFNKSKRLLYLTPFTGQFFKRCPGSSQKKVLNCCNYHILNLASQCDMNCSYCYLQSYLNDPLLKIYTNIDDALAELRQMAADFPESPFRVGTGEITDSLSLDEISLYSHDLIQFFAEFPKWTLEFKTKSNCVDQFLQIHHAKNAVVSWSINPQHIISKEEHGTASFQERIAAAQKAKQAGFQIAFHIDPMIFHEDWEANYTDLVQQICQNFSPEDVHVISIGALRFQPEQRHMMRERFGMNSYVTQAEMFPSEGAKLRYDSVLRQKMFQTVYQQFKQHNSKWKIFLCMETPETWIQSLESQPMSKDELKPLFRPLPALKTELKHQSQTDIQ
ncbi:MAG: radical SAM protein [Pseudobdellovibrionaceae bacterium]|jgi:spore photoproduct lyase